jgi:hypothetical protein
MATRCHADHCRIVGEPMVDDYIRGRVRSDATFEMI